MQYGKACSFFLDYTNYQTLHMVHKLILTIWKTIMFSTFDTFHKY